MIQTSTKWSLFWICLEFGLVQNISKLLSNQPSLSPEFTAVFSAWEEWKVPRCPQRQGEKSHRDCKSVRNSFQVLFQEVSSSQSQWPGQRQSSHTYWREMIRQQEERNLRNWKTFDNINGEFWKTRKGQSHCNFHTEIPTQIILLFTAQHLPDQRWKIYLISLILFRK